MRRRAFVGGRGVVRNRRGINSHVAIAAAASLACWVTTHRAVADTFNGNTAITNQTLTSSNGTSDIAVGSSTTTGTVSVGSDGVWANTYNIVVGVDGIGTLAIANGGIVDSNSPGDFASPAYEDSAIGGEYDFTNDVQHFGSGVVTVTGSGSQWNANSNIIVGRLGGGSLSITSGGKVTSTLGSVSDGTDPTNNYAYPGGSGTVTIDGAGSDWSVAGQFSLGVTGTGIVNVQNGGSLLLNTSGNATAPALQIGVERYVGSVNSQDPYTENYTGNGTLNINGGIVNLNGGGVGIGDGIIPYGQISGEGGNGQITIEGGGQMVDVGAITMGEAAAGASNGQATLTIEGSGSSLSATSLLVLGNSAFALHAGATVTISGELQFDSINANAVTIDGGTLSAGSTENDKTLQQTGGSTNFGNVTGTGSLYVTNGTMMIGELTQSSMEVASGGILNITSSTNSGQLPTLQVDSGGTMNIQGGGDLNVTGSTLTNNATITIGTGTNTSPAILYLSPTGNVLLTGTGTVVLNGAGNDADLTVAINSTLTIDTHQIISGHGDLTGAITNNGTIDANISGSTLALSSSSLTNNGTLEATGGGLLELDQMTLTVGAIGQIKTTGTGSAIIIGSTSTLNGQGTVTANLINDGTIDSTVSGGTLSFASQTITQSGGQLLASAGATLNIAGATILGGSLGGAGTLAASGATLNSVTILASANLPVVDHSTVTVADALTNNGIITVNPTGGSDPTILLFTGGNVSLTGSGQIVLNSPGADAQIKTDPTSTLSIGSGQSIVGTGEINAAFINGGAVDANAAGQTLSILPGSITNNATFESTGGTLDLHGTSITQGSTGQIIAQSGTVNLNTATVSGGSISSSGGALMLNSADLINITNPLGDTLPIVSGSTVALGGTFTNQGAVLVNSNQIAPAAVLSFGAGSILTGAGSIMLNDAGALAQLNGALTQQSGSTIAGEGEINAALTNQGVIDANVSGATLLLQTSAMSNSATLEATGGGTLEISGITITDSSTSQISTSTGGEVLIDSSATVAGPGNLSGNLVNNGTINSNISGQTLVVGNGMTNNNLLEATGGGVLNLSGSTINQGSAGVIAAGTSSSVNLSTATLTGGSLTTSGGGIVSAALALLTGVTLTTGSTLDIPNGSTTTIAGTFVNNGMIVVNSNSGGSATTLLVSGASPSLAGSGEVILNQPGGDSQLDTVTSSVLTIGSQQTVTGQGQINVALINNGTINASVNGGVLAPTVNDITNNGIMEATGGGELQLSGFTIDQGSSGQIISGAGSDVELPGATVSGGTLGNAAGGNINARSITLQNVTIATGSAINVPGNTASTVSGVLTNYGTIFINNDHNGQGYLNFTGAGVNTLNGTGVVVLADDGQYSQLNTAAGSSLTIGSAETIAGMGEINASLTNNGTINAWNIDNYGYISPLYLQTYNMTNNNVMQASNSGVLEISGIEVTQGSAGVIQAVSGGQVSLANNAVITGGMLTSSGGGAIAAVNDNETLSGVTITPNSTLNVYGSVNLQVETSLTNNGTIYINNNHNGIGYLTFVSPGNNTLNGWGTIALNDEAQYSQINTAPGSTVTIGSQQTIAGMGEINAALTNNGTIDAWNITNYGYTSPLYLQSSNMTNNNLMEATNSGNLYISGIDIVQGSAAIIAATTGGQVSLNGATITGGTLSSDSTSDIIAVGGTNDLNGVTIAANSTMNINGGASLDVVSSLTNNGTIVINNNHNGTAALSFAVLGSNVLNGNGTVIINENSSYGQFNTVPGATVTIGSQQTIDGMGQINAALTNNGTIDASNPINYGYTSPMVLQSSNMTNNNVMEGSGGYTLSINGIAVSQGAGGVIQAVTGGQVSLSNVTIISGTLSSDSASAIVSAGGTNTLSSVTLAANSTLDINGNAAVNVDGTLTNNGTIDINNNHTGYGVLDFASAGSNTLSGNGTVILDNNSPYAQLNTTPGASVTIGSGQTITGMGQINAVLTNNGIIDANNVTNYSYTSPMYLQSFPITNNNLIEGSSGYTVYINGIAVTQNASGVIQAITGGQVSLNGAGITGGILSSDSSSAVVSVGGTSTLNGVTIAANTTVDIQGSTAIDVYSSLTNNGTIFINTNGNGTGYLSFVAPGNNTLNGSGIVDLIEYNNYSQLSTLAGSTLTIGSQQTIVGMGQINAAVINDGTINAWNYTGYGYTSPLSITDTITNNGLLQASHGSTLSIGSGVLGNLYSGVLTGGAYEVDANSSLAFADPVSTNAATITMNGVGSSFSALSALQNNSGTLTLEHGASLASSSSLTNSGIISIGPTDGVNPASALAVSGNFTQTAGTTTNNGTLAITGAMLLSGGVVKNTGALGPITSLSITGNAKLDLTNTHLIIDYGSGPDPIASIEAWIKQGYAGGTWTGDGIDSSAAAVYGQTYGLGYADSADPNNPAGLASGEIEIKYTLLGDANLDGKVNGTDFIIMASNFNQSGRTWDEGDFNYDGNVNGADFVLLADNFNQFASQSAVSAADLAALDSFAAANGVSLINVPEPATAGMLTMIGWGILRRRRRSSR